jgi:hypothetical protein
MTGPDARAANGWQLGTTDSGHHFAIHPASGRVNWACVYGPGQAYAQIEEARNG